MPATNCTSVVASASFYTTAFGACRTSSSAFQRTWYSNMVQACGNGGCRARSTCAPALDDSPLPTNAHLLRLQGWRSKGLNLVDQPGLELLDDILGSGRLERLLKLFNLVHKLRRLLGHADTALCLLLLFSLLLLLKRLEHDGLVAREEAGVARRHTFGHVLLPAVVLRRVLVAQVDHHEHVLPHVVVLLHVVLEAVCLCFECEPRQSTDEAIVLHVVLDERVGLTQLGERVDDDTEDDVQDDGYDDHIVREIVDELEREQSVAGRGGVDDRADVATAQALVDAVEEAHEEIFAHGDVFVGVIVQNHVIREDREGDDRVDVDDDPAQHCGEEDGPAVGGNGERDSHQILGLCEDVEQMNREEEGRRRQPEDRGDEEDRVERKRRVLQIVKRRAVEHLHDPVWVAGVRLFERFAERETGRLRPALVLLGGEVVQEVQDKDDDAREALQHPQKVVPIVESGEE
mmetsp:Transcript_13463/g.35807  ORF Transcript_13463/g.35807 Transcript_13463/m.35807 type:complete len:461 (-) Transcript_13463:309-1691(-)